MRLKICLVFLGITALTVFAGALLPQYVYGFGALLGAEFIVFMWIAARNSGKEGRKA